MVNCSHDQSMPSNEQPRTHGSLRTDTCSPVTGELVFPDGPLIKAMRHGWWIRLAALNWLLDDNRQLFVTQSPTGRKRLSRAFRNRLIELHFDHREEMSIAEIRRSISKSLDLKRASLPLPVNPVELLGERSLPLGTTWRQVQRPMRQLPTVSRRIRLFPSRRSIETRRRAKVHQGDSREVFRREEEEESDDRWRRSLRSWRKSILDTRNLETHQQFVHIGWTQPLRRLSMLAGLAVHFDQPTSLIGETGCGKTTICSILAESNGPTLFTVNCHTTRHDTTTESGNVLGSSLFLRVITKTRPGCCSNGKTADCFWSMQSLWPMTASWNDWIVFLNPIKVIKMINNTLDVIQAEDKFRLIGTINAGGDFGKKEVNERTNQRDSLTSDAFVRSPFSGFEKPFPRWSVAHRLKPSTTSERFFNAIFNCPIKTLENNVHNGCVSSVNIFEQWSHWNMVESPFEIYSVGSFSSIWTRRHWRYSYEHGAYLVFIDGMDNASSIKSSTIELLDSIKKKARRNLLNIRQRTIRLETDRLPIGSYSIMRTPATHPTDAKYSCQASTVLSNIQRLVLRAMQFNNKPILTLSKSWRRQNTSRHGFGSVSWLSFHSNQSDWTDTHVGEGRILRSSLSPSSSCRERRWWWVSPFNEPSQLRRTHSESLKCITKENLRSVEPRAAESVVWWRSDSSLHWRNPPSWKGDQSERENLSRKLVEVDRWRPPTRTKYSASDVELTNWLKQFVDRASISPVRKKTIEFRSRRVTIVVFRSKESLECLHPDQEAVHQDQLTLVDLHNHDQWNSSTLHQTSTFAQFSSPIESCPNFVRIPPKFEHVSQHRYHRFLCRYFAFRGLRMKTMH